jgi:hypothetical protein
MCIHHSYIHPHVRVCLYVFWGLLMCFNGEMRGGRGYE